MVVPLEKQQAPLTVEEAKKVIKSCQFMSSKQWSSKRSKQGRHRL